MTTWERFTRMYQHKEADRVPILDSPWKQTIDRWESEGMPTRDYISFFDLDKTGRVGADYSPLFPARTVEETDEYTIYTTSWGATLKSWKHIASTPDFLDFTVKDRESWADAKARMTPSRDRVDWLRLKESYPRWRAEGRWIAAGMWFGFDVTHSWMAGTERILVALLEDPEWCFDMFNTFLDMNIAMLDMIWDEGYTFDEVNWPDDMGYKGTQFFSLKVYRELIKPVQRRAVEWAHAKGVKARLHSCGDITKFIPEFVDIGIDALNPLEVKAGVDPVSLKREYGDRLVLHGGINAVLWDDADAIIAEIAEVVPKLKESGGYIFASDHSIPNSVSLDNFTKIIEAAKKYGAY